MKRGMVLSLALAQLLFAASITFKDAPKEAQRIMPEGSGVILSYYESIKDAKKSVVNISTTRKIRNRYNDEMAEMLNHPLFKHFFGEGFEGRRFEERKASSLGSGTIISTDGYILTNDHVIENADEILVTLFDSKQEYKAKIIGQDPKTDLAVIKIDAQHLTAIPFADSNNLREGDVVFALGNPFGVGESITQGIISALNKDSVGVNQYENFIQTDASINPGNSGGALVDSRGALIGINSVILSKSGGNNGIGFAIPSNMAKDVAKSLIERGKIERGYMGVTIGDLTKDLKEVYTNKTGALILGVEPDSVAQKSGLEIGDLVTRIDDKKIETANDLKNYIGSVTPGTKIEITYERDNKIKTSSLSLDTMPGATVIGGGQMLMEGVSVDSLTRETKERYNIPSHVEGVIITDIADDAPAYDAGLRVGDVLFRIDTFVIKNKGDLQDALRKLGSKKKKLYINRGGRTFIAVL